MVAKRQIHEFFVEFEHIHRQQEHTGGENRKGQKVEHQHRQRRVAHGALLGQRLRANETHRRPVHEPERERSLSLRPPVGERFHGPVEVAH